MTFCEEIARKCIEQLSLKAEDLWELETSRDRTSYVFNFMLVGGYFQDGTYQSIRKFVETCTDAQYQRILDTCSTPLDSDEFRWKTSITDKVTKAITLTIKELVPAPQLTEELKSRSMVYDHSAEEEMLEWGEE